MLFHRGFDPGAVGFDKALELFGGGQHREIAGNEEAVVHARRGELHLGVVLVATEEDADGRLIALRHHAVLKIVEVIIHLARVAVLEGADFQIEQDVATEAPLIEDQIHVVVLVAKGHPELAGLETKARAEFEQEFLQVVEQGRFEIALGVLRQLGEAGEFEDVGIADQVFDGFLRLLSAGAFDDGGFISGKTGPLKKE